MRFNGTYAGSSKTSFYFNFDSWRVNAGNDQWLPALIYSEVGDALAGADAASYPSNSFRAHTRFGIMALAGLGKRQEMSPTYRWKRRRH